MLHILTSGFSECFLSLMEDRLYWARTRDLLRSLKSLIQKLFHKKKKEEIMRVTSNMDRFTLKANHLSKVGREPVATQEQNLIIIDQKEVS
jgi:hypothetical protein